MPQVRVRVRKRTPRFETIESIVAGFEYETTRARAIALVRDRGVSGAPAWVWDVLQDGDF